MTFGLILGDVRFRLVDETNRHDHTRLLATDKCLFLYEYTAGMGFGYSDTNNLISNLKKKPSENWKNGFHYKGAAIAKCASDLRDALNPEWLDVATLVPVPCSKAAGHPDYDDRLTRILRSIRVGGIQKALDIREMVRLTASREAAHEADVRPTVDELVASLEIDEQIAGSGPVRNIGVFDDMLTVGTSFRAMSTILSQRFPGVPITGIFIARRAIPNPFAALED